MKTPLAVISNQAQLLLAEGELTEQQSEKIQTILDSTKKMTNLISNIMRLNQLEKKKIKNNRLLCQGRNYGVSCRSALASHPIEAHVKSTVE